VTSKESLMAYWLHRAVRELEYIQCVENCHSGLCATSEGAEIVKQGMAVLGQTDLADEPILPKEPTVGTLNSWVLALLAAGRWYAPWELCREIQLRYLTMTSDSSITARLRDLRKPRYGSHLIEKRIREGSRAYEYRIVR
jgi:hypothetical protein